MYQNNPKTKLIDPVITLHISWLFWNFILLKMDAEVQIIFNLLYFYGY